MSDQLEAQLPEAGKVGQEAVFEFRLNGVSTEDVSHETTYVWVTAAEANATDMALKESTGVPTPAYGEQSEWQSVRWTPQEPGNYYVAVAIPSGPSKDAHIVIEPSD